MIPLLDLVAQYQTIKDEINKTIIQVLESGQFILGENVKELEHDVAVYLGVRYAIGIASGTDALLLALRALDIGPGDEVIVPAYTFFATAGAVLNVGATPVLVDIDPKTYCMNIDLVADQITPQTKAVIPVHLYGHPVEMRPLIELSQTNSFHIIEDIAQAFGATYDGRKTGSLGDIGCISFFPSKNLGAYGDGGMIVTNDLNLAERVRRLRTHGWEEKYYPLEVGYNSRLDAIQAAILRVKLPHLDQWNERRRKIAQYYIEKLGDLDLALPIEMPPSKHVYHLFILCISNRDIVQKRLKEQGLATGIYYPQPLHLSKPLKYLGYKEGSFPVAELASRTTLAVPLYPEMTDLQIEKVVNSIQIALM